MIFLLLSVAAAVAAAASYLLARFVVVPRLRLRGVLDQPGVRSSHDAPVVRGGGIAVLAGSGLAAVIGLCLFVVLGGGTNTDQIVVAWIPLAAAVAFGVVGFIDDLNSLSAITRLVIQVLLATAIALLIWVTGGLSLVGGLTVALGLILVVNGTNFIDGLNTFVIAWGSVTALWMIAWAFAIDAAALSVVVVSFTFALLGFLPLNRTPALSFLGDVGSYAIGAFLIVAASLLWIAAVPPMVIIAPFVVPMSDVLFTLGTRMLRGDDIFTAHREHVYQRLSRSGLTHEQTSLLHATAVVLSLAASLPAVASFGPAGTILTCVLWLVLIVIYVSLPRLVRNIMQESAVA